MSSVEPLPADNRQITSPDNPEQPSPEPASVSTQGLSPIMAQALLSRGLRLSRFDRSSLQEIQEAVLKAINPIADRLGITIDRVALDADGSLADLRIELSVTDALGLDRHARTLLEKGADAGVPPGWFGKHVRIRDPLDPRRQAAGILDTYITGLIELGPGRWRVRLFDPDNRRPLYASPRMLHALLKKQGDL